jgi:3-methyladenine DNA glycosylase AlkC
MCPAPCETWMDSIAMQAGCSDWEFLGRGNFSQLERSIDASRLPNTRTTSDLEMRMFIVSHSSTAQEYAMSRSSGHVMSVAEVRSTCQAPHMQNTEQVLPARQVQSVLSNGC